MAQTVKNLPAIQETQVRSLGQEDSLEKGMATLSITLEHFVTYKGLSHTLARVTHHPTKVRVIIITLV